MKYQMIRGMIGCLTVLVLAIAASAGGASEVKLMRVPDKGIQPQVVTDAKGGVHLIYFRGEARGGDIFYRRSEDGGETFGPALRVNSHPDSAIAVGTIRGAHLAVGKDGRAHVAWMGSSKAKPRAAGDAAPMLYARLNDAGTAFEPQRNIIQLATGLDGGGSVSADGAGNVYVAWHASKPGSEGEANRRIWIACSKDEGKTFAKEEPASVEATGVCGCCGMRAFADDTGTLYLLYRSATKMVHRDTHLLTSADQGDKFRLDKLHKWEVGTCPMSSFAFAQTKSGVLAAWETDGQVYFTRIDPTTGKSTAPVSAPGAGKRRKHPVVTTNSEGETILVWTEGTGWNRGGSVAWQLFDKASKPTPVRGISKGVPTWSLAAVFSRKDGGFVLLY